MILSQKQDKNREIFVDSKFSENFNDNSAIKICGPPKLRVTFLLILVNFSDSNLIRFLIFGLTWKIKINSKLYSD